MTTFETRGIREEPDAGVRILVDRLWPRGISRERAVLDDWAKDLAPSTELREFFHRDGGSWAEFEKRYRAELKASPTPAQLLERYAASPCVVLLHASTASPNHADVLLDVLQDRAVGRDAS